MIVTTNVRSKFGGLLRSVAFRKSRELIAPNLSSELPTDPDISGQGVSQAW